MVWGIDSVARALGVEKAVGAGRHFVDEFVTDPIRTTGKAVKAVVTAPVKVVTTAVKDAPAAWHATENTARTVCGNVQQYAKQQVAQQDGALDAANKWLGQRDQQLQSGFSDLRKGIDHFGDKHPALRPLTTYVSFQAGVTQGFVNGGKDAVGGIIKLGIGANKVVDPMQWIADPGANVKRLTQTVFTVNALANLSSPTTMAMHPVQSLNTIEALWTGISQPYRDGDFAQGVGRGIFDIGSLFVGAGEANAAEKGVQAASLLEHAAPVADGLGALGKVDGLGMLGDLGRSEKLSALEGLFGKSGAGVVEHAPPALPPAANGAPLAEAGKAAVADGADATPRALPAAPVRKELTAAPNPDGPTLQNARNAARAERGATGEAHLASHVQDPITKLRVNVPNGGWREVDVAEVRGTTLDAQESKNYSQWLTRDGVAGRQQIALKPELAKQVERDAWLRDNWDVARKLQTDPRLAGVERYNPIYNFYGAAPSPEYQALLNKYGIVWNTFS